MLKKIKMKGALKNAGYNLYRNCDNQARERLEQAETNGMLCLKGDEIKDPNCTKIVEKKTKITAKEIHNDKVFRQVEPLLTYTIMRE